MRPASGARLPVMRLNAVVLPAPLPPIRLVIVPGFTSNESSLTACNPPKDFDSSSTRRIGSAALIACSLQHGAVFADQASAAEAGEEHQQQPVENLPKLRGDGVGNGEKFEALGQQ